MADNSHIEWTDATWNPVTGCTLKSPGCKFCYAAELAAGRLKNHPSRAGLARRTADGTAVFTGEVRFNPQWLTQPLEWKRPRMIFVCAHGDLFAEGVPDAWIDQVFAVMNLCAPRSGRVAANAATRPTAKGAPAPQHTFQVLTKRPERMREYLTDPDTPRRIDGATLSLLGTAIGSKIQHGGDWRVQLPLPNVWLGTSIEDQQRADERVPTLLATPAAVRFVSAEPLLGPIDLTRYLEGPIDVHHHPDNVPGPALDRIVAAAVAEVRRRHPRLDWVIAGGESGRQARPMLAAWATWLRDQCARAVGPEDRRDDGTEPKANAGAPFFFKQWGEWIDADEWLAGLIRSGGRMLRDGEPWRPARPMTFADAEWLAGFGGHRCDSYVDGSTMIRVGKKAAGRMLDGVVHNGMPGPSPGAARHPLPQGERGRGAAA